MATLQSWKTNKRGKSQRNCYTIYKIASPINSIHQHGCLKGRSTATNLVKFTQASLKHLIKSFFYTAFQIEKTWLQRKNCKSDSLIHTLQIHNGEIHKEMSKKPSLIGKPLIIFINDLVIFIQTKTLTI